MPYDVQGVLFDLDDTLLDHSAAAADAILQLVRTVPDWTEDDTATVNRWRDLETEHFARYAAGEISMIDQRRARIRSFLALADAPDDVLDGGSTPIGRATGRAGERSPAGRRSSSGCSRRATGSGC